MQLDFRSVRVIATLTALDLAICGSPSVSSMIGMSAAANLGSPLDGEAVSQRRFRRAR